MSDLGTPDSTFFQLQDRWFADKEQPPKKQIVISFLFGFKYEVYLNRDLLKNKLPLPVNECRYIFGCALESKLKPGQCFIRYQEVDNQGKRLEKPKFQTIVGQVIVTKNPW